MIANSLPAFREKLMECQPATLDAAENDLREIEGIIRSCPSKTDETLANMNALLIAALDPEKKKGKEEKKKGKDKKKKRKHKDSSDSEGETDSDDSAKKTSKKKKRDRKTKRRRTTTPSDSSETDDTVAEIARKMSKSVSKGIARAVNGITAAGAPSNYGNWGRNDGNNGAGGWSGNTSGWNGSRGGRSFRGRGRGRNF
jgi:hypothetical protein